MDRPCARGSLRSQVGADLADIMPAKQSLDTIAIRKAARGGMHALPGYPQDIRVGALGLGLGCLLRFPLDGKRPVLNGPAGSRAGCATALGGRAGGRERPSVARLDSSPGAQGTLPGTGGCRHEQL
jgi:hypothetical protein